MFLGERGGSETGRLWFGEVAEKVEKKRVFGRKENGEGQKVKGRGE